MSEQPRLLTLNCHEAWVHQLDALGWPLDIIDGLPNRYVLEWDRRIRPVPTRATLTNLETIRRQRRRYDCIIVHNMADLMVVKEIPGPRIMVLHASLEWRNQSSSEKVSPEVVRTTLDTYMTRVGGHIVAISPMKARSWGFEEDIVPCGVDIDGYPPWSGEVASGIRVANHILEKAAALDWDFHRAAFQNIPMKIVGHNPTMPGVEPSRDWDHLKSLLQRHRFFVHTANPAMEDGYNLATMEAMAAGLPVLGNHHPTSPIEHGVSGFLSDDPEELAHSARLLLNDRALAQRMGRAARDRVRELFSLRQFSLNFKKSIKTAQKKARKRGVYR